MQTLLKKSFSFFNKLFFIPLSLAFNLETNLKIKYFENQREKTQPLYNYYDGNTLGNYYY